MNNGRTNVVVSVAIAACLLALAAFEFLPWDAVDIGLVYGRF
jgi:hypothetical protein